MRKWWIGCVAAGLVAAAGCRKDPCEKMIAATAELATRKGQAPSEKEKADFLKQCQSWPVDVQKCFNDASDEGSLAACFAKVERMVLDGKAPRPGGAAAAEEAPAAP